MKLVYAKCIDENTGEIFYIVFRLRKDLSKYFYFKANERYFDVYQFENKRLGIKMFSYSDYEKLLKKKGLV